MCGRFNQKIDASALAKALNLVATPTDFHGRYNTAPSQPILAVRHDPQHGREGVLLHWGLVPFWADEPRTKYKMINAKAETVHQKPAYRAAFRRRRCAVPVAGFYEWRKTEEGKQPYYIHPADAPWFFIAGIWERWEGHGEALESVALLTTTPNTLVADIHDRMPTILEEKALDDWLNPQLSALDILLPLAEETAAADHMIAVPISKAVNNPRNDSAELLEPL